LACATLTAVAVRADAHPSHHVYDR